MSETAEIVPKSKYTPIQNPTKRHEIVKALLDNTSLTQAEIAEQVDYNPDYFRGRKKDYY